MTKFYSSFVRPWIYFHDHIFIFFCVYKFVTTMFAEHGQVLFSAMVLKIELIALENKK
jgi:hypothetical protein